VLPFTPALVGRSAVAEHTLEVADDQVALQGIPRGLEQTPALFWRHAARNREGPEVDVAGERQTDGSEYPGRWRLLGR
jgi:hypothetical protein